jgi:hypothetical protein
VAIVGGSCRKGRTVVEDIWRVVLCEFELAVEGIALVPSLQDTLLFGGEVDGAHVVVLELQTPGKVSVW